MLTLEFSQADIDALDYECYHHPHPQVQRKMEVLYLKVHPMSTGTCPSCSSQQIVKNGRTHYDKANHKCKVCGRQFVNNPQQKLISQETKVLIDKLLLEKIPLAGIARVFDVSASWLQSYVNQVYEAVPRQVKVTSKKTRTAKLARR